MISPFCIYCLTTDIEQNSSVIRWRTSHLMNDRAWSLLHAASIPNHLSGRSLTSPGTWFMYVVQNSISLFSASGRAPHLFLANRHDLTFKTLDTKNLGVV